jgi:hypothetical protein
MKNLILSFFGIAALLFSLSSFNSAETVELPAEENPCIMEVGTNWNCRPYSHWLCTYNGEAMILMDSCDCTITTGTCNVQECDDEMVGCVTTRTVIAD